MDSAGNSTLKKEESVTSNILKQLVTFLNMALKDEQSNSHINPAGKYEDSSRH